MTKAQSTVLGLLVVIALLEIASSGSATGLIIEGHPVKAIEAYNPHAATMFLVAALVLLFLADYSPVSAIWITVLILVLVVLQRGAGLSYIFNNLVLIGKLGTIQAGLHVKRGVSGG